MDTIKREGHHGEVNHFQALATAVSGTVGLGNIAMVAVAISIGGPEATFWMIMAGLLGMSSKFVECSLGVRYRDIDAQGQVYGGPMYYLSRGLGENGLAKLGKVLAAVFALLCVGASFGGGNAFPSCTSRPPWSSSWPISDLGSTVRRDWKLRELQLCFTIIMFVKHNFLYGIPESRKRNTKASKSAL